MRPGVDCPSTGIDRDLGAFLEGSEQPHTEKSRDAELARDCGEVTGNSALLGNDSGGATEHAAHRGSGCSRASTAPSGQLRAWLSWRTQWTGPAPVPGLAVTPPLTSASGASAGAERGSEETD